MKWFRGYFVMVDRVWSMLTIAACFGLLAAGGCSRTSDGSIEFQGQTTDWSNMFKRRSAPEPSLSDAVVYSSFPARPAEPAVAAPATKPKPRVKAAPRKSRPVVRPAAQPAAAAPAKPVSCSNVSRPGTRVKYVCK